MIGFRADVRDLQRFSERKVMGASVRAMRKAGSTAIRDMNAEARKRIRDRKRIKVKRIRQAVTKESVRTRSIDDMQFAISIDGVPVPLSAYPVRQIKRGVSVSVNRGKRTRVKGAFIAIMKTGHRGVFMRRGRGRLPIRELLGSRPVDALLHSGEADGVAARGRATLNARFPPLLRLELDKL